VPLITTFVAKTKALAAEMNQNFINLLAIPVFNEDFTSLTDGAEQTFTLAFVAKVGSLRVYQSGLRQRLGTNYTEDLNGNGNVESFTMTIAPPLSTPLITDSQKANV
jgi:hypothetical protein